MKKFLTFGLAVALLAGVLAAPPAASAQGPGLVSSILSKMERNWREMKSLRAGVIMQKYNSQIRETDTSYGEVQYIPGKGREASVRLDIHRPQREVLAVAGGQYTLIKPRQNLAYVGNSQSAKGTGKASGALAFLSMSGAQLRNKFNIEVLGEGSLDGPHVWLLKFTPKGGADFKFAEVWVGDDGMALQTRVTERNNDSTLVRLVDVKKNAPVPGDVFKPQIPSGVKVVKG